MRKLVAFKILFFIVNCSFNFAFSQLLNADPFYLFNYERKYFLNRNDNNSETSLRPYFYNNQKTVFISFKSEIFYNTNYPNLENMGNRYIGKGIGLFNGIKFAYIGNKFILSMEPFYFIDENNEIDELHKEELFLNLNDNRYFDEKPFLRYGFKETNIYFNYKDYGLGFSNSNMWWGPGLHTSLSMSNNTTGFPYFTIGTLREKRVKNVGFNFRYVFTELKKTKNSPYFTAIVFKIKFYSNPIFAIGFNQSILSLNTLGNNSLSYLDAATILFNNSRFSKNKHQILVAFCELDFPKSGLKVFFELGTTDQWNNYSDLINYPDHGIGSIFGFRHYGPFNNKNLIMGFEYARLAHSSYFDKRPTPNWYGNHLFGYNSYEGRRWAAHSGSDSDDLYIYFGYHSEKWSFIPSLNYERHGIVYKRPSEVKMELRLDFRFKLDEYYLNILFEREWLEHEAFIPNKWRIGNVLWFGIERDLSNMLSDKIRLINK